MIRSQAAASRTPNGAGYAGRAPARVLDPPAIPSCISSQQLRVKGLRRLGYCRSIITPVRGYLILSRSARHTPTGWEDGDKEDLWPLTMRLC